MSDWLDEFRFAGAELSQGEKSLMRFAMSKERERIIKLLERYQGCRDDELCAYTCSCLRSDRFIELIKGEQK